MVALYDRYVALMRKTQWHAKRQNMDDMERLWGELQGIKKEMEEIGMKSADSAQEED